MAGYIPIPSFEELTDRIHSLPGVGRKTAERIAYHIVGMDDKEIDKLVGSIMTVHEKIHRCSVCGNYTDKDVCYICSDGGRDESVICVVEKPRDIISFERSGVLNCKYHVLHGLLSPSMRLKPSDLGIDSLVERVKNGSVKEVIMATDPSVAGEATAIYVSKLLKPLGVKVTRLGYGLSVGAELQYADEVTLSRSLDSRCEL